MKFKGEWKQISEGKRSSATGKSSCRSRKVHENSEFPSVSVQRAVGTADFHLCLSRRKKQRPRRTKWRRMRRTSDE